MSTPTYDVIVVGGGPAGSACATVLARAGRSVAVLERQRFPREKICGDTLNPRAWHVLDRLGASEELRGLPLHTITGVRVFNSRGREARSPLSIREGAPFVALRRSALDSILLSRAAGEGAEVFEETAATGFELGDLIRVTARSSGTPWTATCRYLLGADGRNSTVARLLQAPGDTPEVKDGRIGLQWYTPWHERLTEAIHLYLLPFGYFGIVNVGDGQANLAMVLDTRRTEVGVRDIDALIREMRRSNIAIDQNLGDLSPCSEVQTTSPITPRGARSGTESVLLAGDAGLIVEPFTGEGIYFALRGGLAAGEELLRRLDGGRAAPLRVGSRFWTNSVVSPALRHPTLAQTAVSLGATIPMLTRLTSRVVARL